MGVRRRCEDTTQLMVSLFDTQAFERLRTRTHLKPWAYEACGAHRHGERLQAHARVDALFPQPTGAPCVVRPSRQYKACAEAFGEI